MSTRLLPWAGVLLLCGSDASASFDGVPGPVGEKIANFELTDVRSEKPTALADFKDQKAVVVIFMGVECPINNAYLPRLAQMHKEYGDKNVQFLAIYSNSQDTAEVVAEHAKKHELPFPALKDDGSRVADLFGAQRNPEVFVLDGDRVVRYRGRIDDQFGFRYKRSQPTRRDLALALDEMLAGRTVSQASTEAPGCLISRSVPVKADGPITYSNQVARILQKNCQECHRPGQIAPFSLLTYNQAVAWSGNIREAVLDERMPPWHADPRHGRFSNDRRLSEEDRKDLLAWIDQGCPKGADKDLPPRREFASDWRIGKPDAILTMEQEYEVPAESPPRGVPYQYFTVDTNFTEDKWVERAEARPGAAAVVHHIVVFIVPPGMKFNQRDPGMRVLCGTAPGDMPFIAPSGAAKKVPQGAKLVFQMHYTPNGKAQADRSSVGLVFAKQPVERQVRTHPVFNPRIAIPPGAGNHEIESEFVMKEDARILSFMPHMHVRGKDFFIEAIYPDGKKETLLSVPRFNFNWQSVYRYAEPFKVPQGTKIHCIAHFDNSKDNPNNPDPTKTVFWGDQTWEEMMIGWMDFAYERKPD
jgi:peroxiredoxin